MNNKISTAGTATLGMFAGVYVIGVITFYLNRLGAPWAIPTEWVATLAGGLGMFFGHLNAAIGATVSKLTDEDVEKIASRFPVTPAAPVVPIQFGPHANT